LKCRGDGHCEVTVEKRKRCKKCRLEKCFQMGMTHADLIEFL